MKSQKSCFVRRTLDGAAHRNEFSFDGNLSRWQRTHSAQRQKSSSSNVKIYENPDEELFNVNSSQNEVFVLPVRLPWSGG